MFMILNNFLIKFLLKNLKCSYRESNSGRGLIRPRLYHLTIGARTVYILNINFYCSFNLLLVHKN